MTYASTRDASRALTLPLLTANLLLPVALLVFAWGFFPYKTFLPGHASLTPNEAKFAQQAPFDKVIFMVVDALRRLDAVVTTSGLWLKSPVTSYFHIGLASSLPSSTYG